MAIFFKPPAEIGDFDLGANPAELKQAWHDYIAEAINDRDSNLFYDQSQDPTPGTVATKKPVPWNGFPLSIWRWFNADSDPSGAEKAFAAADTLRPFFYYVRNGRRGIGWWKPGRPAMRKLENETLGDTFVPFYRQQDEYCEWHVDRQGGHITRISYTSEGPEYWEKMAETDINLVGNLYRQHINAAVLNDDLLWHHDVAVFNFDTQQYVGPLFKKGAYNKFNKWNTTHGAMHLTHPANTLGAEINLAADATVLRPSVQALPNDTRAERLICCAGYGEVNRSSDPLIGNGVNELANAGNAVTLANPVGLYIGKIEIDGLRDPSNVVIPQALQIKRASGDGTMILRAEIVVPNGATYHLDQCAFGQKPLKYGGQIARKITMFLNGLAKPIPGRTSESSPCTGKCCGNPAAPDFKLPISPADNCSDLQPADWAEAAPSTSSDPSPGGGVPLTPAAASIDAFADRALPYVASPIPKLKATRARQ